jgi:spermidine synthase
VIFEKDSVYHHIIVVENLLARFLRFDRSFQSAMYLNDPFESPILYPEYFHLSVIFAPNAKRILMVGLGGGTAAKQFWRDYPGATVEVAELDPMVMEVARRFFSLPQDPRLQITVQDGRAFLRKHQERYDMIVLDAYFADSIPFHLTTREFLEPARARLTPGGVVVSNIYGALRGLSSNLFRAITGPSRLSFQGSMCFRLGSRPMATLKRRAILFLSPLGGGACLAIRFST